jgi:hypothetical protein
LPLPVRAKVPPQRAIRRGRCSWCLPGRSLGPQKVSASRRRYTRDLGLFDEQHLAADCGVLVDAQPKYSHSSCMATRTTVLLVDDLNGQPADTTLRFGLDAREYEMDLTDANAQELRELFGRYISAARRVSGRRRESAAPAKPAFAEVDPAAVRAWAKGKGIEVSARGRIKADVIEAYRAAGH